MLYKVTNNKKEMLKGNPCYGLVAVVCTPLLMPPLDQFLHLVFFGVCRKLTLVFR